jgi:hypothetical protein
MEREGISLSGKTQYAFGGAVLSEKTHMPAAGICPLTSCRYHQKIWCAGVGPGHAERTRRTGYYHSLGRLLRIVPQE